MSDDELALLTQVSIVLTAGIGDDAVLDVESRAHAHEQRMKVESRIVELAGKYKGFVDSVTSKEKKKTMNFAFLDEESGLNFVIALAELA